MDGSKKPKANGLSASKLSSAARGSGVGVVHSHGVWGPKERTVWMAAMFAGMAVLYANRMTVPVAVVEMADEYGWDNRTSGVVLSSFYWGYVLTQVVGGRLAECYGGDVVIWATSLIWSLVTLALSYLAYTRAVLVLARVIIGLAQGMFMPAVVSLFMHRVHEGERNRMLGIVWTGAHIGTAIAGSLGSFLLHTFSWPPVFIAFGLASLTFTTALRTISSRSKRQTHYKLSDNSRSLERLKLDVPSVSVGGVPWRKLLSELPFIVLFFTYFTECLFLHNMMSWSPTYLHQSFPQMDDHAWMYNSLPWFAMATGTLVGGLSAQWMAECGVVMTTVRRTLTAIGLGGSALLLVLLSGLGREDYHSTLLLLTLSCLLGGTSAGGLFPNITDLTPSHAATVFAVMNTVGSLPGALGGVVFGCILDTATSWSLVFCTIAGTNLLGLVAYLAVGSAQRLQTDS